MFLFNIMRCFYKTFFLCNLRKSLFTVIYLKLIDTINIDNVKDFYMIENKIIYDKINSRTENYSKKQVGTRDYKCHKKRAQVNTCECCESEN